MGTPVLRVPVRSSAGRLSLPHLPTRLLLPLGMFDLFGDVKSLVKLDKVCIDNNIFRLHYKVTFIILLTSGILVTSKQYIGDPIDCIVEGIPGEVMDTYCWIHSTFSVSSKVLAEIGSEAPHPGLGPVEEGLKYHKYYQWVCFTLFFQAILFYIPRYLWKIWEGGKLTMLVSGLNVPIVDTETKNERKEVLVNYFTENRNNHNFYALRFFFCEFLNLANVLFQIFLMDFFLDYQFTTYGTDVLAMTEFSHDSRDDPMARVFPKITKCTFHKFGASGTVQKFDGLCVLPLNIINEKIYVFLWFWFLFVAVVTNFQMLYRFVVIMIPCLRATLLRVRARLVPQYKVSAVTQEARLGEWFLLYQLGKNMDTFIYREFLLDLYNKWEAQSKGSRAY